MNNPNAKNNYNGDFDFRKPRDDGLPHRPLPCDDSLRLTPMHDAIVAAFRAAPNRGGVRISVQQAQAILKKAGLYPGPIDGQWGLKSLDALNRLRASWGLAPTRSLDSERQKFLAKLAK